ncbi:D-alanine--poly ligase subunit 2 protein [Marine Group I thaumarchaeote SCGC AAA799-O18]|nr:D-alanine--poly ligase subunit 2 protein [Marine Group I thaumarchaeote SCGC AAA799-O18]
MDVENWLFDWFEKNTPAKKYEISKKLGENYFDNGWLDSLKFIELINDVEQEFDILFSNDEFQNRKFATVNGLREIITGKK